MSQRHVLILDDDREMRTSLVDLFESAGWATHAVADGRAALRHVDTDPVDVIVSDVRMPRMSGLDLLKSLGPDKSAPPVILISAHGDIPTAVEAMQSGAYTFLEKPFDPRRLVLAAEHAAEQQALRIETRRLKDKLSKLSGLDRVLLGETDAIRRLREDITDLAATSATILIKGETGTGKELVARALHDLSDRSAAPFHAISCAALPANHVEQTLFGEAETKGLLARTDGGTLFLDEVAACPLEAQTKLLRVLETRRFTPVGAVQEVEADVRIVSATNEDLDAAVADGRFRQDLLFRLNSVELALPALRERRQDIALLFAHFLGQMATLYEVPQPTLSTEDIATLLAHPWTGNVRELRNVAERLVLASRRGTPSVTQALDPHASDSPMPETLREAVAALEAQMIARAITDHDGRMDDVAEALGIGRRTLNEKIVKLGLRKDSLV